MKPSLIAAMLLVATVSAQAAPFSCPKNAGRTAPDADLAKAVTSAKADPGSARDLRRAVAALQTKGVSNADIVDQAVTAYCPLVAQDGQLDDDRKRESLRRFASELTTFVYDPAQVEDAIVLSVPVKPILSEQIDAAATKAGLSRDAWITRAIEGQLAR